MLEQLTETQTVGFYNSTGDVADNTIKGENTMVSSVYIVFKIKNFSLWS